MASLKRLIRSRDVLDFCRMALTVEERIPALAELFRLVGDPTRLRIVLACANEPVSVGVIADTLGLSASLVSHHLRLLRAARIVRADRQGKQVFYAAADAHVSRMLADMLDHVGEVQTRQPAGADGGVSDHVLAENDA
jgi:DNA-binding transcriptional ArsR family regulator